MFTLCRDTGVRSPNERLKDNFESSYIFSFFVICSFACLHYETLTDTALMGAGLRYARSARSPRIVFRETTNRKLQSTKAAKATLGLSWTLVWSHNVAFEWGFGLKIKIRSSRSLICNATFTRSRSMFTDQIRTFACSFATFVVSRATFTRLQGTFARNVQTIATIIISMFIRRMPHSAYGLHLYSLGN